MPIERVTPISLELTKQHVDLALGGDIKHPVIDIVSRNTRKISSLGIESGTKGAPDEQKKHFVSQLGFFHKDLEGAGDFEVSPAALLGIWSKVCSIKGLSNYHTDALAQTIVCNYSERKLQVADLKQISFTMDFLTQDSLPPDISRNKKALEFIGRRLGDVKTSVEQLISYSKLVDYEPRTADDWGFITRDVEEVELLREKYMNDPKQKEYYLFRRTIDDFASAHRNLDLIVKLDLEDLEPLK